MCAYCANVAHTHAWRNINTGKKERKRQWERERERNVLKEILVTQNNGGRQYMNWTIVQTSHNPSAQELRLSGGWLALPCLAYMRPQVRSSRSSQCLTIINFYYLLCPPLCLRSPDHTAVGQRRKNWRKLCKQKNCEPVPSPIHWLAVLSTKGLEKRK